MRKPIDPAMLAVLRAVDREAHALGAAYMLVGAMAREIILSNVFGLPTPRATFDVDLAVVVPNWEQYDALKERLAADHGFASVRDAPQRLRQENQARGPAYPVDLVPFGGVTKGASVLTWPPELAVTMNVIGFDDVLAAAIHVELAPGFLVRVASLPGLAILKLVAWSDRGRQTSKDAQDLYHLMATYADAGNADRLYDSEFSVLEAAEHDPDIAGARLLGQDAARLATAQTLEVVRGIVDRDRARLELGMVKSIRHMEDAVDRVAKRMEQFTAGLNASDSGTVAPAD